MSKPEFNLPTEQVDLPSKGLIYPEDNPLSSGVIEMKYMSAVEEDILTNQNYIEKGIVFDKLLESMIVSPINLDDLIFGDKDALLIATKILGYGKNYTFKVYENGGMVDKTIDLTLLEDKHFNESDLITSRINEFSFALPTTGTVLTYKLLTHGDEKNIEQELKSLKKLFPNKPEPKLATRLKYCILSVDGNRESSVIRNFVDKGLMAIDSRELRKEIKRVSPGIDLVYKEEGEVEGTPIPINLNFFWPES